MKTDRTRQIRRRAEKLQADEMLKHAMRADKTLIDTLRVCLRSEIEARERLELEVRELRAALGR